MTLLIDSPYTREHLYCRKIKCARHYMLKPDGKPFVMERIPVLKNLKESDAKRLGITLWQKKKDKWGRPIQNFSDYFQPVIAASYAKETIFNASHPICQRCQNCQIK